MSSQSSQTAADRFFGCLPYLLPIADVHVFGMFLFQEFPSLQQVYTPLAPLLMINNSGYGGFILFLGLYLGVVNNQKISRFIRFNTLQAILIGILISLCGLILSYVLRPIIGMGPVTQILMNVIFLGTIAASGYGIIMSAMGKYTEIPQLSETAQIQVDRF
jgi:uncharacterized membrane protein